MTRWKDPFPPTPAAFHDRVEKTLGGLGAPVRQTRYRGKALVLALAALIALLAAAAVAMVAGSARLKQAMSDAGADEVAAMVQELHLFGTGDGADDFGFAVDELIWEGGELCLTYSLSAPEDGGQYLAALFNPTLDGEPLARDPNDWEAGRFFDADQTVLLLGGGAPAACGGLLTFLVDPAQSGGELAFRAALLRADAPLTGQGAWESALADSLSPAAFRTLTWNPARSGSDSLEDFLAAAEPSERDFLRAVSDIAGGDGGLTLGALEDAGLVKVLARREIRLSLDAALPDRPVYNDVAEHTFEINGCRVEIERFRLTRLGVRVEARAYAPAGLTGHEGMRRAFDAVQPAGDGATWQLLRPDGSPLVALSRGASGGAGYQPLPDGTPTYAFCVECDGFIPLEGLDRVLMVPERLDDDGDGPARVERYMEYAIELTPVYSNASSEDGDR